MRKETKQWQENKKRPSFGGSLEVIFLARTVIDQSPSATEVVVIINSPFSWIPLVLIVLSIDDNGTFTGSSCR